MQSLCNCINAVRDELGKFWGTIALVQRILIDKDDVWDNLRQVGAK